MIDAFFKKFIALPELDLSKETMKRFISCAKAISNFYDQHASGPVSECFFSLSIKAFDDFLKINTQVKFTLEELEQINIFIAGLEDVAKEVRLFYKLINTSWQLVHPGTVPGGDDALPLILCSIPHDEKSLKALRKQLDFFEQIYDKSPFLFKLDSAEHFLSDQYAEGKVDAYDELTEFNDEFYDRYYPVTRNLRDKKIILQLVNKGYIFKDEKQLLRIEKTYLSICTSLMQRYIDKIHMLLGTHDNNHYAINNFVGNTQKERRETIHSEVARIQQDIDNSDFSLRKTGKKYSLAENKKLDEDTEELRVCVKKYLCYMDIFFTLAKDAAIDEDEYEKREHLSDSSESSNTVSESFLDQLNHDVFKAVNTATKKFLLYQQDLGDDLKTIMKVSPAFCEYLGIPVKTVSALLTMFLRPVEKRDVSLISVIEHIADKLSTLDNVISKQRERLLSHHDLTKVAANTSI